MGMRTVNDPYGDPSVLVDTVFGTSYDVVRCVANNIDYVKKVSNLFDTSDTIVSNIHQRYVSVEGQNEFELPVTVVSEAFVTVFVNGKWRSPSVTYSATDTTLLFNQALDEGDVVDVMIVSSETFDVLQSLRDDAEASESRAQQAADTATSAADTATSAANSVIEIGASIRKANFDAIRAPLPTDNETQGYGVGSRWLWQGQEWLYTGSGNWVPIALRSDLVVNARHFGDLATGARQAIEAAMDYVLALSPNGGVVELPAGHFNINYSGITAHGRRIGLEPRSNITLRGQGSATRLRVADGANIDLIASDPFAGGSQNIIENFYIEDMDLDGNAENQNPAAIEGFNIRLWGFQNCGMRNVRSLNPNTWGIRIENGDGFSFSNIVTRHGAETNSDGFHFVDVDNVTGTGADILSEGDDAFIIEATNKVLVQNYAIAGLIVKSKVAQGAGARGCLLLVDDNVNPALRRGMRNIHITGFLAEGCRGQGICLTGGDFDSISISGVTDGCGTGLALIPGNPNQPGVIKGCNFDVMIARSTMQSMWITTSYGQVIDCQMNVDIVDPAPTVLPASLYGTRWEADIRVNYPAATNLPTYGILIGTVDSAISVMADGCLNGVTFLGTATGNTIYPKRVKANGGNALIINGGASNNSFHGGKVIGPIFNNASAKFFGVSGAENYNIANLMTDATGVVTVPHGLSGIPTSIVLTPHTPSIGTLRITGRTATDFTVKAVSSDGADIVSSAIIFSWRASL